VLGGALALLAACELAPLDLVGARCSAERPCPESLVCVASRCALEVPPVDAGQVDGGLDAGEGDAGEDAGTADDAGMPDAGEPDAGADAGLDAGIPRGVNLLDNADFERALADGGVPAWRATTGRLLSASVARSGLRSGRVQSTAAAQQPVLVPAVDVPGTELGMLFCATAWVRSDSDAGVEVSLVLRDRLVDGGINPSNGTRRVAGLSWVEVREEHASFGSSTLQLRLSAVTRLDAGEGFYVDDVMLLRASGASCPP
jgi:hypothetical protein